MTQSYVCLENPLASPDVSKSIESDRASANVSDADSYTCFAGLDSHTNLFTEKNSWVDFLTNHNRSERSGNIETWGKGPPGDNPAVLFGKIREVDQVRALEETRTDRSLHAFFVRQKHSNSRLLISRDLFESIVTEYKIFGELEPFLLSFGWKLRECDVGPPHCAFQASDGSALDSTDGVHSFGSFECVYGLRYVELNGYDETKDPWSVRQTAIYQKYDRGIQTWLFISASKKTEVLVDKYAHRVAAGDEKSLFGNPFELHLSLIDASLENWRWYIKSLVERVTDHSNRVVAATVGRAEVASPIDVEIKFDDRQTLKVMEDRVLDLITIFESTLDTIDTLIAEYEFLSNGTRGSKPDRTLHRLQDNLREVNLFQGKVKTLHKRIQGTSLLFANTLDHENAESLRVLAQESHKENSIMRMLTEKGTNDAAAVKIITLITIIYLPTTVVSGFFSTQFVKPSDDGQSLVLADNWWIILAISFPLTAFTFAIWYSWIKFPWKLWWGQMGQLLSLAKARESF